MKFVPSFRQNRRARPLVFLSYRRSESRHVAGRLRDSLDERFGEGSVFMDVEDIDAGADFIEAITRALQGCSTLLVIIGPQWRNLPSGERSRLWNPDDVVRLEVEAALKLGVQVIPLLVDDAQMPEATDLPASLHDLTRRQAITIDAARWRASVQDIVAAIERATSDDAAGTRRPLRRVMAYAIAAELLLAAAGLQTVGGGATPGLEIVVTATTVAALPQVGNAPTAAQTRVAPAKACQNEYLGFIAQVPSGMDASTEDGPPFANCEAFAFGEVIESHYDGEDEFSVPVMFASTVASQARLEEAASYGYEVLRRQHIVVSGQPSMLIETSEHARDGNKGTLYWRDNIVIPNHKTFLVGQLRLPQSVGWRKWRAARSMFESMVKSLTLAPQPACSSSDSWHCGDFYWTEEPVNTPATLAVVPSAVHTEVGKPVTVVVNAADADAQEIDLRGIVWGDENGGPALGRAVRGPNFDSYVRVPDKDPRPHGPWPPPDRQGGTRSFTCTHTYKKSGNYTATFAVKTTASGSTVPDGHDPYGDYKQATATIYVAPAAETTEPTQTTQTTAPTADPAVTTTTSP
jgi:hypothetical protein